MEPVSPSAFPQRIWIAIISLFATCIALFLGFYQWGWITMIWDPVFHDGTQNVLDSKLSHEFTKWIRIPDGILGAVAYFADSVFAMGGSKRRWQDRPWLVILFGIAVIPVGAVSCILVILQGIVVKAWCFWCLLTATASVVLIFLAYNEVMASLLYLKEMKKRGSWKIFWNALWGTPHPLAKEVGEEVLKKRGGYVGKN